MKCPNCEEETEHDVCEHCGTQVVSVVDDTMESEDEMIAAASIPSLATLFRQGKKRGLIKAMQDYGQTA